MLESKLEALLKKSIQEAISEGQLGDLKNVPELVGIEYPKSSEHGDRACSIAMKLTKEAKLPPRSIAESIVKNLNKLYSSTFTNIEIAGPGFINLTLDWNVLEDCVADLHAQDRDYGRVTYENRPDKSFSKTLIEYVSANPTGDLHIGHGRQAVIGSGLANLLKWAGYQVESEFYINDAGAQMEKLARSARAAILIQEGQLSKSDYPEDTYPLESMLDFLKPQLYKKAFSNIDDQLDLTACGNFAREVFLAEHKKILKTIGVEFDSWFSEKETIHNEGQVSRVCNDLSKAGYVYEQDGAKWFKAKEFGDERDRVLQKSDGSYTYLASDIAYHQNKLTRGFDKMITVWGADHYGQEVSLKGALRALGGDEAANKLEVIFVQLVSLKKGSLEVKMSKRSGDIVNVRDLLEEVGADALRYFLVESQSNNRVIFDLELAKTQNKDNPVYYIQYAHARSCSILRTLTAPQLNQDDISELKLENPVISSDELDKWLNEDFKSNKSLFASVFAGLEGDSLLSTRLLILQLLRFPESIKDAAYTRSPYKIANYLKDLAAIFHQFYTHNRVLVDDKMLLKSRVSLVVAVQKVIRNALFVLGISAPTKM